MNHQEAEGLEAEAGQRCAGVDGARDGVGGGDSGLDWGEIEW